MRTAAKAGDPKFRLSPRSVATLHTESPPRGPPMTTRPKAVRHPTTPIGVAIRQDHTMPPALGATLLASRETNSSREGGFSRRKRGGRPGVGHLRCVFHVRIFLVFEISTMYSTVLMQIICNYRCRTLPPTWPLLAFNLEHRTAVCRFITSNGRVGRTCRPGRSWHSGWMS